MMAEMYRVLKPGGLAITLCPSWEYNYQIYFEDYSHRTPFMRESLRDIQLIHSFENVEVEFFYQLPSTWGMFSKPAKIIATLTRYLIPKMLKKKIVSGLSFQMRSCCYPLQQNQNFNLTIRSLL